MTAAIGVSLYPDQAQSAAELMNRADESMYRVKALAGDAQYGDVPPRPAAPARRRDDASRRRPV
jgi:GGDEF domain-containing protein